MESRLLALFEDGCHHQIDCPQTVNWATFGSPQTTPPTCGSSLQTQPARNGLILEGKNNGTTHTQTRLSLTLDSPEPLHKRQEHQFRSPAAWLAHTGFREESGGLWIPL